MFLSLIIKTIEMSKLISANKESKSNVSARIEMMRQARREMIDKKRQSKLITAY